MKQKYCTMNKARQEHSPDCVTVAVNSYVYSYAKGTTEGRITQGTARHSGADGYADTS